MKNSSACRRSEQQKALLARALAQKADVPLRDEPTSNPDKGVNSK